MKSVIKAIISSVAFVLVFLGISYAVINPYMESDRLYFQDAAVREETAGSYDLLFCGSSHGLCAFDPEVIDPVLDCNSYNLCGAMMTVDGINEMIETEVPRNPVKTVVVEVCFNTLSRDSVNKENGEGMRFLMPRMDSWDERILHMLKWVSIDNYSTLYSDAMQKGMEEIEYQNKNKNDGDADSSKAHAGSVGSGYHPKFDVNDVRIPEDQVGDKMNTSVRTTEIIEENLEQLEDLLAICEEKGARIVFVVTPLCEATLWCDSNMDDIMAWYKGFCSARGYEFYDFNLLKERTEFLSDVDSYYDYFHLCDSAAEEFSLRFAQILDLAESGEDVSGLFYESYEAFEAANPYYERYYAQPVSNSDVAA